MIELAECLSLSSGYLASLVSNVLATVGSGCAQALQQAIPPFQLNFSRYIFQLFICTCLVLARHEAFGVKLALIPYVLLAGACSNLFNIAYYTASALLPLGMLLVVTNVTQIINSTIINKLVFDKMVAPLKLLLIGLMIIGLFFILQPSLVFRGVSIGPFDSQTTSEGNLPWAANFSAAAENEIAVTREPAGEAGKVKTKSKASVWGYFLAIGAGIAATSRGAVYKAKLRSVSVGVVGFWVGVLGIVPSLLVVFYVERPAVLLTSWQLLLLFGHGFGAASCSTLNIFAQQKLTPVTWAMMDNSKLILNFALQYTLLSQVQPGKRNAIEVLGAVIAFVAMAGSVLIDLRAERRSDVDMDGLMETELGAKTTVKGFRK